MSPEVQYAKEEGWASMAVQGDSPGPGASKWHYFQGAGGVVWCLCNKFGLTHEEMQKTRFEVGHDDSPSNCAECKRKLMKLRAVHA